MAFKPATKRKGAALIASFPPEQAHPRICFERIIPDELDPERPARQALREYMLSSDKRKLNAN